MACYCQLGGWTSVSKRCFCREGHLDRRHLHQPIFHCRAQFADLAHETDYRTATIVQVWLGEACQGSDKAVAFLEEVSRGTLFADMKIRGEPLNGQHLDYVADFLARPWWKRIWVQQATLTGDALLHCGHSSLSLQYELFWVLQRTS